MRLLLLPLFLLLAGRNGADEPTFKAGEMPACDSKHIRELLVRAVHQSPAGQRGLDVAQIGTIGRLAMDASKPLPPEEPVAADGQRLCQSHCSPMPAKATSTFT